MTRIFTRKFFYRIFLNSTRDFAGEQSSFKASSFRLQKALLAGMLLFSMMASAQLAGDYRSVATGNWTALATWQRYSGTAWVTPTAGQGYPGQLTGTGTVNIINGNVVTVNSVIPNPFSVLLIGNGATAGTLSVAGNSTLSVPRINVASNGTITFTGNFDLQFPQNAVFTIEPGGLLSPGGPCNSQRTIRLGTTVLSTCNGNSTAYSFAELMSAGGFVGASPSYTKPCIGGTLQLFAIRTGGIGPFTYSWSGPNNFSAVVVNPTIANVTAAAAGVYTVTISDNNFNPALTSTNSVTVQLNPLPTLTGASQAAVVCAGGGATINLTGLLANSTSTIAYTINGAAQTPVTGVVANASGAASFTSAALTSANNGQILQITSIAVTSATPNCSANFTQNVTLAVNAAPTLTGANQASPVCTSGSATINLAGLRPNTTSTINYTINGVVQAPKTGVVASATGTASFTTSNLTTANNGQTLQITSIIITSSTPNCSANFTQNVTLSVTNQPTATISYSGSPYCQNSGSFAVTLTGTTGGFYSYENVPGSTLLLNPVTGVINTNGTTPGTYTVHYQISASGNCGAIDVTTPVTINSASVAPTTISGTTSICAGGSTTLTVSGGSLGTGAVARWYTGSCGGILAGTGLSIIVSPGVTTNYFVRYEGTCNSTTCVSQFVTVNNASVAPTGISGNTNICTGGSTTLTGTGGTLGSGATAKWYTGSCGGTAAGTGNSITVSPTANTTYYFRYEGTCNTTPCVSATVTINNTNSWVGGGSNLWSDGTQWSCGTKPLFTHDVLLGNNGTPILDENYTAAANLIAGATLVSLTINPNAVLTISGTANFNNKPVIIKSTAAGTGAVGIISGTLTNATEVTVERYFPADRAWRLVSAPPLTGSQTLKQAWCNDRTISDPAQAAAEPTGIGTLITGQGYTNPQPEYDYIGWSLMSSIRYYQANASGGSWPATVANTPSRSTTLTNAAIDRAYLLFVRGDRTVTTGSPNNTTLFPKGSLRTGTQTYTVAGSGTHKYEVFGNPYASVIDFESMMNNANNSNVVNPNRLWIWNSSVAPFGGYNLVKRVAGQWYLVPSNFDTDPGAANANARYIQSGQGFILEPTATGGTLSILESNKTISNGPFPTVFSPMGLGQVFANLYYDLSSGLALSDGVMAVFGDGNSLGTSDENDVSKAMNLYENFGLMRNGDRLTMEAHPSITNDDTLYFDMSGTSVRAYALRFMPVDMPPGLTAKLIDNFTGKEENISMADSAKSIYKFNVTSDPASAAANRFKLVFKAGQILPITLNSAKAYQVNQLVQVDWQVTGERDMKLYEVEKSLDGRLFTKQGTVTANNAGDATYNWLDNSPIIGSNFYRIKAVGTNGTINYSQVLLVKLGESGNPGFSLYPNPMRGRSLGIQITNLPKGVFDLKVYNQLGQVVTNRSIRHLGGSASEEIRLDSKLAAGIYKVGLTNSTGFVHYESLIVQ